MSVQSVASFAHCYPIALHAQCDVLRKYYKVFAMFIDMLLFCPERPQKNLVDAVAVWVAR